MKQAESTIAVLIALMVLATGYTGGLAPAQAQQVVDISDGQRVGKLTVTAIK